MIIAMNGLVVLLAYVALGSFGFALFMGLLWLFLRAVHIYGERDGRRLQALREARRLSSADPVSRYRWIAPWIAVGIAALGPVGFLIVFVVRFVVPAHPLFFLNLALLITIVTTALWIARAMLRSRSERESRDG